MIGLTARQRETLEAIISHINIEGYPPTLRELGEATDIFSTNAVNDHLVALEKKGFIDRSKKTSSRGIKVRFFPDGSPAIVCVYSPVEFVEEPVEEVG